MFQFFYFGSSFTSFVYSPSHLSPIYYPLLWFTFLFLSSGVRNEGVASKKGGHMEYALAHTPISSYLSIHLIDPSILSVSSYLFHLICFIFYLILCMFVSVGRSVCRVTRLNHHPPSR